MSNVLIEKDKLDVLATAISNKSGEPLKLTLDEMVEAVDGIEAGITPTGNIDITESGTTNVTNYATATVPKGEIHIIQPFGTFKTVSNVRKWGVVSGGGIVEADEYGHAGYVADETWETVTREYNAVPSGTTITPTESSQTIGGASYMMEGAVTVGAISSTYVGSGITQRSSLDLSASGATVTAPAGYYESSASKTVASGSATAAATISGTSATVSTGTNTLTLSKTISNTPQVTAGYVASGTAGNSSVSLTANVTTKGATTYNTSATDQTIASGTYLTGAQTIRGVTTSNLTADNIKNGVTVTVGDSADADRVLSVTGTYSGGGTSKNVQVLQSTSRTNASSLTKVLGDLTVSKTGTYDVYWSGGRSNTSTSYTWGTRLYVNGTGYGTENTTWSNNCQSNHLSNVSLTANQKLSVYARGRTGSYYTFVPMLTIIEA